MHNPGVQRWPDTAAAQRRNRLQGCSAFNRPIDACSSPKPFSPVPLSRPLRDNLIPDPHPVIPFSFSCLSPFLPESDGQTDLSRIII